MRAREKTQALAVVLLLVVSTGASAGGPLVFSGTGVPYIWDIPISYRTDRGSLGIMTNAAAIDLVENAFAMWSAIPTANLSFVNAGLLTNDVDTVSEFNAVDGCTPGSSAIIFDADGSLFTALGFSSGVIGFAGPSCITTSAPFRITKGIAALNGKWRDGNLSNGELTADEFFGTFVHEFGHFINLDHNQVNGHFFIGDTDDPGFVTFGSPLITDAEIMFPFALDGMDSTPKKDDAVAVSALYPAATFLSSTGAITGHILRSDAVTPFKGADVIARNVLDPFGDAVSNVSGARFTSGGSTTLRGLYELYGLTPGANYAVEVVRVNPQFTGGSGVGPLSPPVSLPGPEEFYNGAGEAAVNPPDAPLAFVPVPSVAGVPTTGIDVILSGRAPEPPPPPPPAEIHDLALISIKAPTAVLPSSIARAVYVKIQNRSDHAETIPDMATLKKVVGLQVLPFGGPCRPEPVVTYRQRSMPVTLKSKGSITVVFDVVLACANDPARGVGHEDYSFVATIKHSMLPGAVPDDHPVDDVCPRDALATPGHIDPNPDSSIVDLGCGKKKPNGTFGLPVKTDVYLP